MLGIGQLQCVSYDVVCDMFYCVDSEEEALISKDDRQKQELCIHLRRLVFIETRPEHF
jgi:hypothetical protein